MSSKNVRPTWWQLYLMFPLLLALFAVDNRLKISSRAHQIVQIGIVLLVYGLVHLWVKSNEKALSTWDHGQPHGDVSIYRFDPARLPDANREKDHIIQIPDSEVKGLLGNTFEQDIVDTEFLSGVEVSQELNKE